MAIDATKLDTTHETASANGHTDWLEPEDEEAARELILQTEDRVGDIVPVPEWRMKVLAIPLTGVQRALYEKLPRDGKTGRFLDSWQAAFEVMTWGCVHPRTHKPIFKKEDAGRFLGEHNATIMDMLARKILILSGLMPSQMDLTRKNSETTPTSSTTTASPSDSDSKGA